MQNILIQTWTEIGHWGWCHIDRRWWWLRQPWVVRHIDGGHWHAWWHQWTRQGGGGGGSHWFGIRWLRKSSRVWIQSEKFELSCVERYRRHGVEESNFIPDGGEGGGQEDCEGWHLNKVKNTWSYLCTDTLKQDFQEWRGCPNISIGQPSRGGIKLFCCFNPPISEQRPSN